MPDGHNPDRLWPGTAQPNAHKEHGRMAVTHGRAAIFHAITTARYHDRAHHRPVSNPSTGCPPHDPLTAPPPPFTFTFAHPLATLSPPFPATTPPG